MHLHVFILQMLLFPQVYSLHQDDSSQIFASSKDKRSKLSGESTKSHGRASTEEGIFINLWFKHCCPIEQYLGRNEKPFVFNSEDKVNVKTASQIYNHIINLRAKRMSLFKDDSILLRILMKKLFEDYNNFIKDTNDDKDLFTFCRKFSYVYSKFIVCDSTFIRNRYHLSNSILFTQRKLLQYPSKSDGDSMKSANEVIQLQVGGEEGEGYIIENSTFNGLSVAQWKAFLTALHDNMSKDHIWAMLCLVSVMVVMVVGMKVCGLRPIDRQHEIHQEYMFRDSTHTVSIREILALKRPYLPKGLIRFSKQWKRRKPRKKTAKMKERDIADPISDNSDDERIIYSKPMVDL